MGLKEEDEITIQGRIEIWEKRKDVGDKPTYEKDWKIIVEKIRPGLSDEK